MQWTDPRKMSSQYVEVFLPRFKIEKNYEIKHHLRALGLKDIFDESRADLSGVAAGGRRSEERRVGKECLRLCRSRWSPYH